MISSYNNNNKKTIIIEWTIIWEPVWYSSYEGKLGTWMFECIKKKKRWFILSESLGIYCSKRAMVYLPKYYSEDKPKTIKTIHSVYMSKSRNVGSGILNVLSDN